MLLGLAVTATIALQVDEVRGVEAEDAAKLLMILEDAIRDRTGAKYVVQVDCAAGCPDGLGEPVRVRMLGIPTKIRVLLARPDGDGGKKRRVQIDLPRDERVWPGELDALVGVLFPKNDVARIERPIVVATPSQVVPLDVVATPPEPPSRILPWTILGGSAAVAIAGVVAGGFNLRARDRAENASDIAVFESEEREVFRTGLAANILFGVAAIGASTGLLLFAVD